MLDLNQVINDAIAEQWEKKVILLPYPTGLPEIISQKQVKEIFSVSVGTVRDWERLGLKRYKSKADSSMVFYKIKDIYELITKVED